MSTFLALYVCGFLSLPMYILLRLAISPKYRARIKAYWAETNHASHLISLLVSFVVWPITLPVALYITFMRNKAK